MERSGRWAGQFGLGPLTDLLLPIMCSERMVHHRLTRETTIGIRRQFVRLGRRRGLGHVTWVGWRIGEWVGRVWMRRPWSRARARLVLSSLNIGASVDQRGDQPQQRLMFGTVRVADKECADLDLGSPTTRRSIGAVLDEDSTRIRIAGEKPPVPIRAGIKLSRLKIHCVSPPLSQRFAAATSATS